MYVSHLFLLLCFYPHHINLAMLEHMLRPQQVSIQSKAAAWIGHHSHYAQSTL